MKHIATFAAAALIAISPAWAEAGADAAGSDDSTTLAAPEFAGSYSGHLQIPNGPRLTLVFHVSRNEAGDMALTMDSPDQGMTGMQASNVRIEGNQFIAEFPQIGGSLTVELASGEPYSAVFFQGMAFQMELSRGDQASARARPQEPTDRDYTVEAVSFSGGGEDVTLAGELTLPGEEGVHPAIVLISGSGPQDRDETFMGHKPFLVLSDYFTQNGYAVLRYDDRGFGESTGKFATATTLDFAKDAAAAMEFLRNDPRINQHAVVLMGHSEGGLVAPLAAQIQDAAAMVLIAAPSVPLREVLLRQGEDISRAEGVPEEIARKRAEVNRALMDIATQGDNHDDIKAAAVALMVSEGVPETQAQQQARNLVSPWYQWVIDYNPVPALKDFDGPALAIFGTKDVQVSANLNADGMKAALSHPQSEVMIFENHNHLFQIAETGVMTEYAQIETTMEEAVLNTMLEWLNSAL